LILHKAAWVLPIATPPIRRGAVLVSRGRVVACGADPLDLPSASDGIDTIDHGAAAILPGLVNAHTHLELSWMRNQVPPSDSMPAWAGALMALRRTVSSEPPAPIVDAVRDVRAAGTSLVGDVTNTLAAYDVLADSELGGAIFRELLGFSAPDPAALVAAAQAQIDALVPLEWLRPSIVQHAPYSVSQALFAAIAGAAGGKPVSVHVGESAEEIQFLRDGTGAWRELLAALGVWNDSWQPPGCGAVEYLDRLGVVNERLLAVHCTRMGEGELALLGRARSTIVTCPRSNRWTGSGVPPIERFYASGARVAIGTDSLASVQDLNVFAELAEVRRLAPSVPAARLIASATVEGAAALGFGAQQGTLAPGMRADLIAVRVPAAVEDVEEYLLSGIEPDDVHWLDAE
jgi:cytosine/adenosine deaminase-related metal-dependent hydrolase